MKATVNPPKAGEDPAKLFRRDNPTTRVDFIYPGHRGTCAASKDVENTRGETY